MPSWSQAILTNHALAKMRASSLSESEIKNAFKKYNIKENSPIPNCTSFIRRRNKIEIGVYSQAKKRRPMANC